MTVIELARAGRFTEITDLCAPELRALAGPETLRAAWASCEPVTAVGEPVTERLDDDLVSVTIRMTTGQGEIDVIMAVGTDGNLHGLRFAPVTEPWAAPPYADQDSFDERDVSFGGVAGTVSVPRPAGQRGQVPGVVLLGGGGPFDRDGTSGANKPLKDLAWGLASRGVAAARFDKLTPGATVTEEYVPPAVAAVRMLRAEPGVDPGRVFVLGHSMGGKVAPRVAVAEPDVAGLVIMAGDTQPMHEAAVRVARYLVSLDPAMTALAETVARQAAAVADPALSSTTPASELLFGWGGEYWLDLRGYDPVGTAATVDRPMLILQGGRDYQVTVEGDLAGWRAGLGHRQDVELRVHEADDHLFFPGEGPSTPASYAPPQHVDPAVVEGIAGWLAAVHTPRAGEAPHPRG
ncbi:lysophospholipase [Nonomuraea sp. NBC_01738]|uniref:alpha/beta hydrolase family protein n=1 Tax=Nonomuraea sp. NBC_01738 TaxID=2976003 RepID=UPI002E0F8610|nr:lysophospholipase [Nonomuraea sp. NBC_01738]